MPAVLLFLDELATKSMGQKLAERGFLRLGGLPGVEDDGVVVAKLGQGLATGAAGHRGGTVAVGDGDSAEPERRSVFGDGARDGALLGTAGQAVRGVLHVAAGDEGAVLQQQRRTDAEVAVWSVGVSGGLVGEFPEPLTLRG